MFKFINISLLLFIVNLTHAKNIPLEHFARLPDTSNVTLAPDGKKLASVIRIDAGDVQGSAVQVTTLATGEKKMLLFTDNTKYFLNGLTWKDSRTLFASTYYPSERDTWVGIGQARYKTREGRVLIIDTLTEEVRNPFKKSFLKKFLILPTNLNTIIDYLPNDPDHVLMALPGYQGGYQNIIHKVNIKNQRKQVVQNSKRNIISWSTDRQHRIRAGHFFNYKNGENRIHIKDINTGKWIKVWPYKIFSKDEVSVIGFGEDPNEMYIRAYYNGLSAIFKVNLKDPELKRELVYSNPSYDVGGRLVYSPSTKEVIGITSSEGGGTIFFDEKLQKLQAGINKAMPNRRNFVYSFSNDMKSYLIYSTGHTESGTYYLGRRNPSSINAVAYRYKNLPPQALSTVKKYNYKARDGMQIEAQLTLPTGFPDKNLPTLMFPHGGPQARDNAAFDYWAQLLANKGYAVLQMNFRGSEGQGYEFRNAGLKNWGEEMQDDVEDGALQLIKDGISDPTRVGIIGASYGGYAALMGAVKTPDFYKVSISLNGVSDVHEIVRANRIRQSSYNIVEEQIGKLDSHLRDISPINHADKIKAPVLLIHGENDRQVDIKHSHGMRDALKKSGKIMEYLELPNEDHYLSSEKQRIAAFRTIDAFLDKYFPAIESR